MFKLLAQHPEVSVSDNKEPHYFCADFHQESDRYHGRVMRFRVRSESQYLALFGDRSRPVAAEATPAYLYSRVAAAKIHAFNPGARILAIVRDPIVMLRSLHAKLVANGQEDLCDFQHAIAAEPARRAGLRLPAGLFWPSSLFYSDWVKFAEQIERYRSLFPADRIKVLVYDDFLRDNLGTYAEVVSFLGLDPPFQPQVRRVNENRSLRFPLLSRAAAGLGDLPVKNLLSHTVRSKLRRMLHTANSKPEIRAPLDPRFQRELRERFRPGVEDLGRLLRRDLVTLWGYDRPAR